MTISIDSGLTQAGNILALIKNTRSGDVTVQSLVEADLSFGAPTERDGEALNTALVVTSENTAVATGTTTINYTRLAPGAAVASPVVAHTVAHDAVLADVAQQIVDALSVELDVDVTVVGELPAAGDTGTVSVVAVADHLLYVGATEITITVEAEPIPDLEDLIGGDQDGFVDA